MLWLLLLQWWWWTETTELESLPNEQSCKERSSSLTTGRVTGLFVTLHQLQSKLKEKVLYYGITDFCRYCLLTFYFTFLPQIQPSRCPQICGDREGGRPDLAAPAAYLHNLSLTPQPPTNASVPLCSVTPSWWVSLCRHCVCSLCCTSKNRKSLPLLFAGAFALQTMYHLPQWQPSALPLICPNSTTLQDCVRQAYEIKLFKVEILLICIAYCTRRITHFIFVPSCQRGYDYPLYSVLLSQQFCYCSYRLAFVWPLNT